MLTDIPSELRDRIIQMTHAGVFRMKFFKSKPQKFSNAIVYGLQPYTLGIEEVLYQTADIPNEIYFI